MPRSLPASSALEAKETTLTPGRITNPIVDKLVHRNWEGRVLAFGPVVLLEHVHVQLLDHSSNGIAKVPLCSRDSRRTNVGLKSRAPMFCLQRFSVQKGSQNA